MGATIVPAILLIGASNVMVVAPACWLAPTRATAVTLTASTRALSMDAPFARAKQESCKLIYSTCRTFLVASRSLEREVFPPGVLGRASTLRLDDSAPVR